MPKRRIRIAALLLVLAAAPSFARLATASTASDDCPRPLRAAVLDLDESRAQPEGLGVTALQSALLRRIAARAEVALSIEPLPYPRALASFGRGDHALLVVAEEAGRSADADATRVPLLRLHFVSHRRLDGRVEPAAQARVGTINGFVFPPTLLAPGESLHPVNNYSALMRMLGEGRVARVLVARPSVDAWFASHPGERAQLDAGDDVRTEPMDLHLGSRLPLSCRERLRAAAALPRAEIAAAFARALPGVDPAPFLLVEPGPGR